MLHRHKRDDQRLSEPEEINVIPGLTGIPKSKFKHFYVTGIICHTLAFTILISCLFSGLGCAVIKTLQHWVIWNATQIAEYKFDDSALSVLLVFIAEWLQVLRRTYECYYVSSFSKSTMSMLHYILGLLFYALFGIGLLISVPLEKLTFSTPNVLEVLRYIIAVGILTWAFHFQHKSMVTLASLRQEQKDKPPDGHFIPHGHLFELVSSPHFFCEIIIYATFCFIFKFENMYLNSIAIFVAINQAIASNLTHKWYKEHFPNYPSQRKNERPIHAVIAQADMVLGTPSMTTHLRLIDLTMSSLLALIP
ncbi:Steroid 5 alpha-reductase 3 [Bulinus truncatus]|nr:Steroid 5 alpha-reductase 3 [Bulinus truncatus]